MRLFVALVLAIASGACASYAPYSWWRNNTGYLDTQLAENRWQVIYRGNPATDRMKVIDFTLLRAAELTISHGYKYFVISAAVNASRTNVFVVPGSSSSTTTATGTCTGAATIHCSGTAVTTHREVPPTVYRLVEPALGIVIDAKHEPAGAQDTYDARLLYGTLKQKYKLK